MLNRPDFTQCFTEIEQWPGGNIRYIIPPTGYLIAIGINPVDKLPGGHSDDVYWRAKFEITDQDETALYGEIKWEWSMYKSGIAFYEPIPNMNASHPYIIKRVQPSICPDLQVVTVSVPIERI